jgi:hypothetical protein
LGQIFTANIITKISLSRKRKTERSFTHQEQKPALLISYITSSHVTQPARSRTQENRKKYARKKKTVLSSSFKVSKGQIMTGRVLTFFANDYMGSAQRKSHLALVERKGKKMIWHLLDIFLSSSLPSLPSFIPSYHPLLFLFAIPSLLIYLKRK